MATKAKKTTSKDKIAFLERQCEQLGKERNEIAIACEGLKKEVEVLKEELNSRKKTRHWLLRKLGL